MASSVRRALAKYRDSSTRIDSTRGEVITGWRRTLRKCSVPGICPSSAMCGWLVRHRCSASAAPTPAITPISTPASNTPARVTSMAVKSALE